MPSARATPGTATATSPAAANATPYTRSDKDDLPRLIAHAKAAGVFFEINADPDRLDLSAENVREVTRAGIKVAIGHAAENLGNAAVVVYSSAVKSENPELAAARLHLTPTVKRAPRLTISWGMWRAVISDSKPA